MDERVREAEKQREGLSLASLFPKPRPMWTAQPFYGFFGDAFIGKITFLSSKFFNTVGLFNGLS